MKLGYIDYLNCFPFYYRMFNQNPVKGVNIVPGYPSDLNRMMVAGTLDMSPVSAATCADLDERFLLLPDFCLSSVGYVGSVVLVSKVPVYELNRRPLGITSASHTSVVLLKILMKKYFHVEPVYVPSSPLPCLDNIDAALLIGNEAMAYKPETGIYTYDLGELWLEHTGYPVVFAVFVIRESIVSRYNGEISEVNKSYHRSINFLHHQKESVVEKAKERYPGIDYDIDSYYSLLHFEFSENLKSAFGFYHATAAELGFLKPVREIKYY